MTRGVVALNLALAAVILALAAGSIGCRNPVSSSPLPPTAPAVSIPPQTGPSGVALFGTVFERTAESLTPIPGVLLYCDACGEFGHTAQTTDADGRYRFSGDLAHGGGVWLTDPIRLLAQRDGYVLPGGEPVNSPSYPSAFWTNVKMNGDTEFDVVLARK
jgi:hypothetical protein